MKTTIILLMAFHRNLVSMLGESLPEFVAIAKLAVETPTTDGKTPVAFTVIRPPLFYLPLLIQSDRIIETIRISLS